MAHTDACGVFLRDINNNHRVADWTEHLGILMKHFGGFKEMSLLPQAVHHFLLSSAYIFPK